MALTSSALNSDNVTSGTEHVARTWRLLDRWTAKQIADAIAEEAKRKALDAGLLEVPEGR